MHIIFSVVYVASITACICIKYCDFEMILVGKWFIMALMICRTRKWFCMGSVFYVWRSSTVSMKFEQFYQGSFPKHNCSSRSVHANVIETFAKFVVSKKHVKLRTVEISRETSKSIKIRILDTKQLVFQRKF